MAADQVQEFGPRARPEPMGEGWGEGLGQLFPQGEHPDPLHGDERAHSLPIEVTGYVSGIVGAK